ncbi:MAG: flagellar protein FlgN [Candidatus Sedimenticola sp. 20ELBAFRAG]
MSLSTDQQQPLANLLSAELATANQLKSLLEQEYETLRSGNPDQIMAVAQEKESVLQRMRQHDRDRQRFIGRISIATGKESVSAVLESLPEGSPAQKLWHELQEVASALHQQNTINGGMVALGQRHTRQALDILSGKKHDGDTYGPGGEQRGGASTDPLAKV